MRKEIDIRFFFNKEITVNNNETFQYLDFSLLKY